MRVGLVTGGSDAASRVRILSWLHLCSCLEAKSLFASILGTRQGQMAGGLSTIHDSIHLIAFIGLQLCPTPSPCLDALSFTLCRNTLQLFSGCVGEGRTPRGGHPGICTLLR